MQNKAYSIFSTKSISEDNTHFTINGIASTPSLDSDKDSLKSTGATFRSLPFPFLLNHDHKQPVGQVTKATPTENGIEVEIKIPYVAEQGKLKEQTDYAIHAIKYQVINGLSVGFTAQADNVKANEEGGYNIDKFEVYELSLTALQANINAFITSFKSLQTESDTDDKEVANKEHNTTETTENIALDEDSIEVELEAEAIEVSDVEETESDASDIVEESKTTNTKRISNTDTTKHTKTSVKLNQYKNKNTHKVKLI